MKKLFRLLFGLIGFIVIVVIGVLVYVAFSIYDETNDTSSQIVDNYESLEYSTNKKINTALDNVVSTKSIQLTFTENELNEILYAVSKNVTIPTIEIISMYSKYYEDGTIELFVPVEVYKIKSILKTKLLITDDTNNLTIKLDSLMLGKLTATNSLFKEILLKSITDDTIEEAFLKQGLVIDVDLEKLTINLKKSDLKNKLLDGLIEDDNYYLYKLFVDMLLDSEEILDINFTTTSPIGATLNLSNLEYNYDTLPYSYDDAISVAKSNVITLLENNVIDLSDAPVCFEFLIKGYERLSDEDKSKIDKMNLSSINITTKNTYNGIIDRSGVEIEDIIISQRPEFPYFTDGFLKLKITESNINDEFNGLDIIGTSLSFASKSKDEYNLSYIILEKLYIDIINDGASLNLIININGLRVGVSLDLLTTSSRLTSICTKLSGVNFGKIEATSENQNCIMKYLEKVLANEKWLIVSSDDMSITFQFGYILSSNDTFNKILELCTNNIVTSFKEDEKEGMIEVSFSFPLT